MARTYSDETKAQVMAALLTGQSVSSVAKDYEIPKGTVSNWKRAAQLEAATSQGSGPKKDGPDIGTRLTDYLDKNLAALAAQAEVFAEADWLRTQEASDLAVLHGVMTDKAVRLLEAFGRATETDEPDA